MMSSSYIPRDKNVYFNCKFEHVNIIIRGDWLSLPFSCSNIIWSRSLASSIDCHFCAGLLQCMLYFGKTNKQKSMKDLWHVQTFNWYSFVIFLLVRGHQKFRNSERLPQDVCTLMLLLLECFWRHTKKNSTTQKGKRSVSLHC